MRVAQAMRCLHITDISSKFQIIAATILTILWGSRDGSAFLAILVLSHASHESTLENLYGLLLLVSHVHCE